MSMDLGDAIGLLIATLRALWREWSGHASGRRVRLAEICRFTLWGLGAGVASRLWSLACRSRLRRPRSP